MIHLHLYKSEMRGHSFKTTLYNDKSNQFVLKMLNHEISLVIESR